MPLHGQNPCSGIPLTSFHFAQWRILCMTAMTAAMMFALAMFMAMVVAMDVRIVAQISIQQSVDRIIGFAGNAAIKCNSCIM